MDKRTLRKAKAAFEKHFKCSLCMHDCARELDPELLPTFHLNRFCTGVKKDIREIHSKCISFDKTLLQQRLLTRREPFFKRCPAGFIECVFPVFREGRLARWLFAGPFSAKKEPPEIALEADWKLGRAAAETPPELPDDLEGFTALGELLAAAVGEGSPREKQVPGSVRELILEFLKKNCRKNIGLGDIAELLSLTPPRASDCIFREFGQRFCALLRELRLETACRLLENSGFSVEDIACRSGFRSGAYFHRVFHKEFHVTPREYRLKHQKNDV